MKPTVCLNMIVKDEEHVLARCLESVLPFIDAWAIIDTGSSDGTQEVVRKVLGHLPGELRERPWVDFSHNRNEALEVARGRADYALLMDADNELVAESGAGLGDLDLDSYNAEFRHGDNTYHQKLLVRLDLGWQWRGVLHEGLYPDREITQGRVTGLHVLERREGARSKRSVQEKYADDVGVLIKGLKAEPNNSRYVFYLAQSYRDANQPEKALRNYLKRVAMGGWDEEVWFSRFQVALLSEALGLSTEAVVGRYLEAHEFRPHRAESLMNLARYCREQKRWESAYIFAGSAMAIPRPDDILFVDESTYAWRAQDEYSIACYWTGRYEESMRVCKDQIGRAHV